jgi:hypothetical protein
VNVRSFNGIPRTPTWCGSLQMSDTPANREWFLALKERLKQDFQQIDIWMIAYPIEVL